MHIIGWWLTGLLHKAALPYPSQLFPRPLALVEALDAIAQRLLDVPDVSDQAFKAIQLDRGSLIGTPYRPSRVCGMGDQEMGLSVLAGGAHSLHRRADLLQGRHQRNRGLSPHYQ